MKKFPEPGTPLYDRVVSQVETGVDYRAIADSLDMKFKGFKDALRGYGITRKQHEYGGYLPPAYEFDKSATLEEHLETMQRMDNLIAFHQRVPSEITIRVDTDRPIIRVATSDWHLGAFGVDYVTFKQDIDTFVNSGVDLKVNVGGDGYHNVIQASKVGSSHNQTAVSVQKGAYVLTLEKLSPIIDTIRTGNHNYWTALLDGEDWDREIARRIKLLYMKHYALVHYHVGNYVYPWLMLHKSKFNSSFNITHSAKQNQRLYFPEARVVVTEHTHVAAIEQYQYDGSECVAIRTGTYDVYDDYAQQNGFFGAHVCNPAVVMFPDRDKLVGFKDYRDAITYVKGL